MDSTLSEIYAASWADLRLRKRSFYGLLFGFPLFWVLIRNFILWTTSPTSMAASAANKPWIVIAYVLLSIVAGAYLNFFRCPRCQKRFFSGQSGFIFFKDKCTHCGLSEGALTDDGKTTTQPIPFFRRRLVVFLFFLILLFALHGPYEEYKRHHQESGGSNSMSGSPSAASPVAPVSGK